MNAQSPGFPSESLCRRRVRILFFYLISLSILVIVFLSVRAVARFVAERSNDGSNLRQIFQTILMYSADHHAKLPHAPDIWSYAQLLSEYGLDTSSVWQSRSDPAYKKTEPVRIFISTPQGKVINPAFREMPLSFALPKGQFTTQMPSTTPVIWTRGLQPDGTWASHSPYGNRGGHITFIGGNTAYYKNLSDDGGQLQRFDGKGPTANILESLPPSTQISEYEPTPSEKTAWTKTNRLRAFAQNLVTPWSVCISLLCVSIIPGVGHSRYGLKIGLTPLIVILVPLAIVAAVIGCIAW